MKKVIIVANFCRELSGEISRFTNIAKLLSDSGRYDVELITSDFIHLRKEFRSQADVPPHNFKITLCHEPGYLSHKGIRRLYSHWRWGKNVLKHIKSQSKPDIIYCAIPSLTAAHDLSRYCRKNGVKFVIDVQDLWPEATFMLFKSKILRACAYPLTKYVDKAYSSADAIVAVSKTYVQRAKKVNKRNVPELAIFLGSNGEGIERLRNQERTTNDAVTIGYIGTISYSYELGSVISAIKILNDTGKYKPIKFLVMGDGPLKQQFESQAKECGVNCEFTGMLQYDDMIKKLCACDIAVNPIVSGSAASIINKVGDYALAGLPVINTQDSEEYRALIDAYKCGINCQSSDPRSLADAINILINNQELQREMSVNSARLGQEKFDRRRTYSAIVKLLEEL